MIKKESKLIHGNLVESSIPKSILLAIYADEIVKSSIEEKISFEKEQQTSPFQEYIASDTDKFKLSNLDLIMKMVRKDLGLKVNTLPEITKEKRKYLISLEKNISNYFIPSILVASGPSTVRNAIELSSFLEEAQKKNSDFPRDLLQICLSNGVDPGPKDSIGCLAFYVFGYLNFQESFDYILSYVSNHEQKLAGRMAPDFATHALKLLTNQKDTDEKYISYNSNERHKTIIKALHHVYEKNSHTH